ncbi:MAG: Spy/CpxP family protein refolding chaperone [Thermoanaerobaculia bacterium]
MSIQTLRKSVLGTVAAAVILAGGVWAGHMAAGPLTGGRRLSVQKMFTHLADRLDLSDSQREQVKGVLRTHKDAILAQVEAERKAHQDLRQAIAATPFDEGSIRARAAALGQVVGDAAVLRAQIRSEVMPILNDDQKQKLETLHERTKGPGDRLSTSLQQFLSTPGPAQ